MSKSNTRSTDDTRRLTPEEYTQLSLSGKDELGRIVLPSDGNNEGKYVGIFYFLWCGTHNTNPHDIDWLEKNNPSEILTPDYTQGIAYYWGKPLYGYYHNTDEWVVTRHVEMFVNAGIDFVGLDLTNAATYDDQLGLLLKVLHKFEAQGFKVPQVMFLTRRKAVETAKYLYDKWCKGDEHKSLWFAPNGKPMISCATEWDAEYDDVMSFFDVKYYQWPNEGKDYPNGFAWIEWQYPQPFHSESRMMSVSVAQHVSGKMSQTTINWGRSYNHSLGENQDFRINEGLNYQSQWDTALSTDELGIVFITGWNEWIAGKWWTDDNVFFVDEFDMNYSRDIEMMEGGYGDNYYMQTVENIRAFKSTGVPHYKVRQKSINIHGDLSQWDDVSYVYRDFNGDAIKRNCKGALPGYSYEDYSNRNDIVTVKVATDKKYAYLYVETADDITDYDGGANWMNILIGTGSSDGFGEYEYLINATPNVDSTSVSKFTGLGFDYTDVGTADLHVNGRIMQIRVALSMIGVSRKNPFFVFKVCDNITHQEDFTDYYISGDCAPLGRLSYTYGY